MSQEIEVKYLIDSEQMQTMMSLAHLADYKLGTPKTQRLVSTYYDTPSQDLREQKVALRLRETGEGWVQTIKGDAPSSDGLTRRTELEWTLDQNAMNLDHIRNSDFANIFSETILASIKPVFVTDFQRLSVDIHLDDETVVEMALDQGHVKSDNASEPICELELELKSGNEAALLAFSNQLKTRHGLKPGDLSKAKRGYALLNG